MMKLMRLNLIVLAVCIVGCSSPSHEKQTKSPNTAPPAHVMASNSSNPVAKWVELVGFRVSEKNPGKLQVEFAVVNHSEADIGDVKLKVDLTTTAAKPNDPPLISFPAQLSLGPSELKNVTVDVPTKLRAYELPDWQFLIANFAISEPK